MAIETEGETGSGLIAVEVVYATSREQAVVRLSVPAGSTARQAVEHSGLLRKFAQTALPDCQLGVFGRICRPEQILQSGDRVEIYHPLLADPKTARRDRARRQTKQD